MALLEKHRNTIYTEFRKTLGEEATQALLSQFPARDVDEPVTKADLQLVRADMDTFRADMDTFRAEMETFRAEVRLEIAQLGDRLTNRMLSIAGLGLAAMTGLLALFT